MIGLVIVAGGVNMQFQAAPGVEGGIAVVAFPVGLVDGTVLEVLIEGTWGFEVAIAVGAKGHCEGGVGMAERRLWGGWRRRRDKVG